MDKQHILSLGNERDMHLRVMAFMENSDELGFILTIHLVCERIVETWIEAASNNRNLFHDIKSLSFSAKLQMAKNCDIPEYFYIFSRKLNIVRNQFAHNLEKTSISNDDLRNLEYCAQFLPDDAIGKNIHTNKIITKNGECKYTDTTKNKKIGMIFFLVYSNLLANSRK
ncbi:hypothetical protein [Klebsiella variicola]|uniref:hypothetical protein n=1 Tax=Klebsiella variicola TaxID=244366 RepID=UPI0006699578|nr:hypothetical protein [Klebsiella variicola]VVJ28262.1 Uncharacterised protein [Klebsiella quasipneumoniae]